MIASMPILLVQAAAILRAQPLLTRHRNIAFTGFLCVTLIMGVSVSASLNSAA